MGSKSSHAVQCGVAATVLFVLSAGFQIGAQACVVPPSGLIGWWPAEESASDMAGGNHGTLLGDADFAPGKVGSAFDFNGVDAYVTVGNPPTLRLSGNDFTVEAWVRFPSLVFPAGSPAGPCFGPGCDMDIVNKMVGEGGNNVDGWRLLKESDNRIWFCLGDGSNGCGGGSPTTVRSSTVVGPGVWYHLAAVKGTQGISIYVNGVLEESKPLPPFVDTDTADLQFGLYSGGSGNAFMYGLIDDLAIFNRALSASEIRSIFNAGSAGKCQTSGFSRARSVGIAQWVTRMSGIQFNGQDLVADFQRSGNGFGLVPGSATVSAAPHISNLVLESSPGDLATCVPDYPDRVTLRFDYADPNGDLLGGRVEASYSLTLGGSGPVTGAFQGNFFPQPKPGLVLDPPAGSSGSITWDTCWANVTHIGFSVQVRDSGENISPEVLQASTDFVPSLRAVTREAAGTGGRPAGW
ncbi:MAG: LamG domain-containing protein [Deltaproteobacteria bacterium]|nr:LamG domain-containing protein [Deltaproteobacteria bacterium]